MSVLVYTENWDGKFKKLSFELITYASKLAGMMGTSVTALSIGQVNDDELAQLAVYGADKIVQYKTDAATLDNQFFTAVIAAVAASENATVLLLANNNAGKALAPRLSVRLKAGLGAGVSKLPASVSPFIVYKKAYSGNAFSNIQLNTEIKVLTLAQNSFGIEENRKNVTIETASISVDAGLQKTELRDVQKQSGKILITDAEIVVSGGRGMKSPDNWGPLLELADLLGAATACSRPVSDEGWRPHEEHTGQTGKIIAPNLYIAIGISGATQHIAGVSSSKFIVAINSDKDAPIFEAANYGIIGDAAKVLPKLVEAVREVKNK